MNLGRTIFAQLMDQLPLAAFRRCVERYHGDYKMQSFSSLDHFLCLAFAQLTFRESLRDIETCLATQQSKLYHIGFRGRVRRSTLAYANEHRDWRIFAEFARVLIGIARDLYQQEPLGIELANTVYAFDSTTVDLCLSLFPWAQFRRRKSAVKLHTLLDVRGSIPANVYVTGGRVHDVNLLDQLLLEPGAFYLLDRGYLDFARLYWLTQAGAFFVTRSKRNLQFYRRRSLPVDKSTGLRSDQHIRLTGPKSRRLYPDLLRRIHYIDAERDLSLVFLTNSFRLPALTVTTLYRLRWRVELFFRWIKQHLRIKSFYGTSENAVKVQVWTAIATYVLVAIVKKRLGLNANLHKILQILSIALFEKTAISAGFFDSDNETMEYECSNQLKLFNL